MTTGEYGLVNRGAEDLERFKGPLLRKIREKENNQAKQEYGLNDANKPRVSTILMRYIDGYVPFNLESVERLKSVFDGLNPSIVIGADPVFSIDWHHDHMASAYNTYFAVKKYQETHKKIPYSVYQTFKPDTFIPTQSWEIFESTLSAHKSQMTPLGIRIMRSFMENVFYRFRRQKFGLRKISFENPKSIIGVKNYALYSIFSGNTPAIPEKDLYFPSPEELGLKRIPEFNPLS